MNDLGPEARSILEAARGAEAPTRADRQRIKHAVLLRVATLGAVSTTAGGAVAMSLAAKVTVAALTVAVLGGGSVTGEEGARGTSAGGVGARGLPDCACVPNPACGRARSAGGRGRTECQTGPARGAAS
jgi:hypothetical protein